MQDNPVGNGNGVYHGRRLFRTKPGHASLVPLDGLLRAEDFQTESQIDQQNTTGGRGERVMGRRKMRQRQHEEDERQKRRLTPHHGEDNGEPEDNVEEDDRTRLIDRRALADRAVITSEYNNSTLVRDYANSVLLWSKHLLSLLILAIFAPYKQYSRR